jgi:hypothetical protein
LADASRASIAELKAQWWQTETPNYLQWSADVGAIETTYTDDTTDNILQRAMGVKNAGVKYATDVGKSIKDYDVATAAAREEYISKLMTIAKSIGDTLLDAERDKEIALADAELQKQLTGNESAYSSAVQAAIDAYTNTTTSAEASRKSQEQTALSTMNTKLSDELKNKEADIAAAEREYDQTVASLDAQYGSASSNGDTGVEGATRRSAIKTRDAQYYAARDTSWANTLSASINLGTTPWTVKAITAANAEAAYSASYANAQAAHDAAMLDAMEDWQLSSRESLTDLLFTEGQSRETYNVATSNVYANWEDRVGNLLGDKPEGTGWGVSENSGSTQAGNPLAAGWLGRAFWGGDETDGASENQSKSNLKTDKTPNPRGARELAAEKTISDEDEVKNLEPYLAAMYGKEAMLLLNAFRETGSEVRFVGHWHWGLWWTGGSDLEGDFFSPGIVIDKTLSPPEKAEHLMRQLIAASPHSGMRAKIYFGQTEKMIEEHQQSLKQGFNKAVPMVQGIAKAYIEGIAFVGVGADIVVTANELYENQNPWALLGLLPLVPSNVRNASGNIVFRAGNKVSVKISENISGVLSRLNKAQLDELTAKLAKANTDKEAQTILEQFAKLADNAPGSVLDGSIRNVNPNRGAPGYTNNCQNCVIAADRTLGGTPTVAKPSLGPLPRSNLEVLYGGKFTNVSGMMEIGAILRESGNGARGIVGGSHPRGYGHVWNVVNQNGVIRFLDSQGTLLKPGGLGVDNFDDFSNFQFLLTAPGRK